ncbi:MAG TPA: glutamine amidotransferase [Candidatus Fraserbacteria bacterium]|nr:glutamine amidotransferase [Candidatus Fraserbacteria bacterium]
MKLTIAWLFPSRMDIYGDRGNVLTLQRRAEWRGIITELRTFSRGDPFDPDLLDIIFLGGGQDRQQRMLVQDLIKTKGPALRAAIEDGLPTLAVCGGYQLLGEYYQMNDGDRLPGVDILPVETIAEPVRYIGNIIVETDLFGARRTLVGFENHNGCTYLKPGARPLGRVRRRGSGNNGRDHTEGVIYRNAIGTYLHGALLPKNPVLADFLLRKALNRRYGVTELAPLDDSLETEAHDAALRLALKSHPKYLGAHLIKKRDGSPLRGGRDTMKDVPDV